MTLQDRAVGLLARAAVGSLRWGVLHLPRWFHARFYRALAWLVWVVTGNEELANPVREFAEVFAAGPPFTVTLERIFTHMEFDVVASAARCLARRSPYGEP